MVAARMAVNSSRLDRGPGAVEVRGQDRSGRLGGGACPLLPRAGIALTAVGSCGLCGLEVFSRVRKRPLSPVRAPRLAALRPAVIMLFG